MKANKSPRPGQNWRVYLQPVESTNQNAPEATVMLGDFDARTDTWTVRNEGDDTPIAIPAKQLIRRV